MNLPEWAKLARLTTDELALVAFYRSCTKEVRWTVSEFCRLSATRCAENHSSNSNVIVIARKIHR